MSVLTESPASALTRPDDEFPVHVSIASPMLRLGAWMLEGFLFFVTFGVGWLIWAAFTAPAGQTPAKALLELRVICGGSHRPAGFMRMLIIRGLVVPPVCTLLIVLTLGAVLVLPFLGRYRQSIWDLLSDCYVVHDPNDAWSTKRSAASRSILPVSPSSHFQPV